MKAGISARANHNKGSAASGLDLLQRRRRDKMQSPRYLAGDEAVLSLCTTHLQAFNLYEPNLPVNVGVTPAKSLYQSYRIGAALLASTKEEDEDARQAIVIILRELRSNLMSSYFRGQKDALALSQRVDKIIRDHGGGSFGSSRFIFAKLSRRLGALEFNLYRVGLQLRANLILRLAGAPKPSLAESRNFIADTQTRIVITSPSLPSRLLNLTELDLDSAAKLWSSYSDLAAYCFVALHFRVPLRSLLSHNGYEGSAQLAYCARKIHEFVSKEPAIAHPRIKSKQKSRPLHNYISSMLHFDIEKALATRWHASYKSTKIEIVLSEEEAEKLNRLAPGWRERNRVA